MWWARVSKILFTKSQNLRKNLRGVGGGGRECGKARKSVLFDKQSKSEFSLGGWGLGVGCSKFDFFTKNPNLIFF